MENLRFQTMCVAHKRSTDYNTGSNDIIAFVNDNPMQEYVVKADAATSGNTAGASSSSGCNPMNMNNYTATDNKDGQSISTLGRWLGEYDSTIYVSKKCKRSRKQGSDSGWS